MPFTFHQRYCKRIRCAFQPIRAKKPETLIQQGIDAETAKVLTEKEPEDKYSGLRWGCILVGLGIGALCDVLLGLPPKHNIFFWIVIAAGIGMGLLVSFVIEYKLTKKEQQEKMKNEESGE